MRLTTKGRLAVLAMIDVALQQRAGPVALGMISRRQNISLSYLEQMFADLRRRGLVVSTRGPGGGYEIERSLATISVADIVFAVDRLEAEPAALPPAEAGDRLQTAELWTSLSQHVVEFLRSITLQQLVDAQPPEIRHAVQAAQANAGRTAARPVQPKPFQRPAAPNSVFQLAIFPTR